MDGGIATAGSRRHAPIANHGIEAMHDAKSDVALATAHATHGKF